MLLERIGGGDLPLGQEPRYESRCPGQAESTAKVRSGVATKLGMKGMATSSPDGKAASISRILHACESTTRQLGMRFKAFS